MTTAAEWIAGPHVPFCGCKGFHTPGGCPVEPFPFERQPMQQTEYDAIRDDVYEATHDDRALLPEAFAHLLAAMGILAQTSADPDGFAAQTLRQLVQRAKSGVPMNEPSVDLVSADNEAPKWSDLFGLDPDYTGGSCSVDYIRWSRGAETVDEFDHEACWSLLTAPLGETP